MRLTERLIRVAVMRDAFTQAGSKGRGTERTAEPWAPITELGFFASLPSISFHCVSECFLLSRWQMIAGGYVDTAWTRG